MAAVYTKLLFLNSTQTLVNTLSHTTAHRIQLIIHRRQSKSQIAMPHYTPLHNLLPVSPYPHNRRHYIFHYPSSLLFLPLDVLALTPSTPNTYPRTYHTPYSRTYTHRGWVPRESTQEKIGCRSPEVVGGQTRSKGLPTDPRTQPAGGRDNGPPRRLEFG